MAAPLPRLLTIAGSDSGGGAGIQADLKTFAALNTYGMSAITAVTAQNTVAVTGVHALPPEFVAEQIDAVATDIGIDAAKTGMLANADIVEAVAGCVRAHGIQNLVVDPVMVSKSGASLLHTTAERALRDALLPLALIVTPNAPEAAVLTGLEVHDEASAREAARVIHAMGARCVLVKGGHLAGEETIDIFFDGEHFEVLRAPRISTRNTHGTGCTYSAAIAAYLGKGLSPFEAITGARAYLQRAIETSFPLGAGHGPLNHLWPWQGSGHG
jgi:hydroxymethylpyrimidine/phosphomethylpyrimidine kinase